MKLWAHIYTHPTTDNEIGTSDNGLLIFLYPSKVAAARDAKEHTSGGNPMLYPEDFYEVELIVKRKARK